MGTKITNKYLLDLVSRSFALTIPLLDKNKKSKVEVQYLLARIIDTIEDSMHNTNDKETLITGFINILKSASLENIKNLDNFKHIVLEKTINDNDKILIENIDLVLKTFFGFDSHIKNMSISYLNEMGYGMIYYQDHTINNFEDLNDYCYYVAGTVGVYLTELIRALDNLSLDKEKAKKFGRFLQKVNIIKDVRNDFKENRIFWPKSLFNDDNIASYFQDETYKDRAVEILNKMVDNAMDDFEDTIKYIMEIEKKAVGYRHFCLIAALMAYKTLNIMYNNYNVFSGEPIKMPKKDTMDIVTKVKANYYTNKKLEDLLETYLSEKYKKIVEEDK